jgi:hypothetical protein
VPTAEERVAERERRKAEKDERRGKRRMVEAGEKGLEGGGNETSREAIAA